ncbi:OsmC family protein [Legionella brunensis]|uniref:OsmC-like protein n=1 Tax=Legionella brunensis TaxID=29422 RepID=A0A0W0ST90_9GAMM|nr:OsmC family protein [Legionella brunensis]KTC86568.1 OsmC-like protein [Legionella brunensis]
MMSEYNIHLAWKRETEDFDYKTYNRAHTVFFYGGPKIEVSSSPDFIRDPQFHTPEELLAAAVSSCYLLTFLAITAKKGFIVDSYRDNATCLLGTVKDKQAITEVILRPVIAFGQENRPDKRIVSQLFAEVHNNCLVANALTANITVNPTFSDI